MGECNSCHLPCRCAVAIPFNSICLAVSVQMLFCICKWTPRLRCCSLVYPEPLQGMILPRSLPAKNCRAIQGMHGGKTAVQSSVFLTSLKSPLLCTRRLKELWDSGLETENVIAVCSGVEGSPGWVICPFLPPETSLYSYIKQSDIHSMHPFNCLSLYSLPFSFLCSS